MLIIRRLNCINAASGIVTLSQWPSGAQVERKQSSEHVFYMLHFKVSCVYCCQLSCVYCCSCLVCIVVILCVCCTMCVLLFLL
jgi:hypothetical protein